MADKKIPVSVYLEQSLYDLVAGLAREQHRAPGNFIAQFLSVSLEGDVDRAALIDKMNPSMAMVHSAMRRERERLEKLAVGQ